MPVNRREFAGSAAALGAALASVPVAAAPGAGKPAKALKLCAEVYANSLDDPGLVRAIDEYGIDELDIHRSTIVQELDLAGFSRLKPKSDPASLAAFRKLLRPFQERNVTLTLSGPEPRLPRDFFEAYPEARYVTNGLLWKFLEQRTTELFRQVPELDGMRFHLWEAPLLSDSNYFGELYWARPNEIYSTPAPYYAPSDYLKALILAFSAGAQGAGKECTFTTFSHFPWQERLLIEAVHSVDRAVPFRVMHMCQPGDFNPCLPASAATLSITGRDAILLFDAFGEYWGWTLTPYCFPEELQQRLEHALARNPGIHAVASRVSYTRPGLTLFGSSNEVNFYALSRLVQDPATPVENIWRDWAEKRFGGTAAPKVISALKRTAQIGKLVYYFRGVWVQSHSSLVSDLRYMEAAVLHTGRSTMEWAPQNIGDVMLIKEFTEQPREHTIEVAVADRLEALRLNGLSLDDIEAVRSSLPAGEYDKLRKQFTLQRHFIQASIPHIEAFLRYFIQKRTPSRRNLARLDQCLATLESKAAEVESVYREEVPILTAKGIRRYIREVREAAGRYPTGA